MKFWNTMGLVLSLVGSSAAFAQTQPQEIRLGKKDAVANGDRIVVVRDHLTPKKVKLYLDIDYSYSVCVRHDTRTVYGQDSSCGYDTHYESRETCSTDSVCEVWLDGECRSSRSEHSCSTESVPVSVMRSCYYEETYCSEYGTQTSTRSTKVNLKFKSRLHDLKAGEEERFEISGRQTAYGSMSARFTANVLSSVEPTETDVRYFGTDRVVFIPKKK